MSASLAGTAVSHLRAQVPAWGRPWFDVTLSEATEIAVGSRPTFDIAGTPVVATVVSGGAYEGSAAYRLVGGYGGWGKTIPSKPYIDDGGIKASKILTDAARACGETIADLPATRLGPHYSRNDGPAVDVLNLLVPRNWYIGFDGVTRVGQRPRTTFAGDAPRVHVDTAGGTVTLAVESVTGLLPGVSIDGRAPATDVEIFLEPKKLTARVWAGLTSSNRRVDALLRIVRSETARMRYLGLTEFRVVTQSGERLNLQPVRVATGFPDLSNVPVRPGVSGCKATVALGELVLVAFVDGDPSRPVVVAHDAADSPGWMPLTLQLGATPALGIARRTDAVQAGPFAGAIVGGSVRILGGL